MRREYIVLGLDYIFIIIKIVFSTLVFANYFNAYTDTVKFFFYNRLYAFSLYILVNIARMINVSHLPLLLVEIVLCMLSFLYYRGSIHLYFLAGAFVSGLGHLYLRRYREHNVG